MAASGGTKAIIAALLANAGIAVAKLVAFLLTGSASMLAESIHSVADASNQGLLLLGGRRARRQATPEHPFGFGRERYFWSFIVALVLFTLGGLFSVFEGVEKYRHPHEVGSFGVAIGVLVVAIVMESFSMRTAVVESNHARGEQGWWEFIRHARAPELPVVLLEDLGALLGLVFALVGVLVAHVTGEARWDAVGSIAIGVLLLVIAIVLMIEMKSLLIGESARPADIRRITEELRSGPNIAQVLEVRTQHIGPEELIVGAKVALEPGLTVEQIARSIDTTEANIRRAVPAAEHLYIEPDL